MSTFKKVSNPRALERLIRQAKDAGLPRDQIERFVKFGYIPQPHQLAFHAAARQADLPDGPMMIGQGGARGGAKSHAAFCQVALDDCQRFPNSKWLVLRSVGKSAREAFEDFIKKAVPGLMPYYISSRLKISFPNGSEIILGGFQTARDIEKYIGLEYHGILMDDSQLIPYDRRKSVFASMRSSLPGWRPRGYLTFNPGGIGHAQLKREFVDPWRTGKETTTRFFFSLPEHNKFLNPEYVEYLETLSGWLYRAWRKGDFNIAAGQYFVTWNPEVHVQPHRKLPIDWQFWCALDYGFSHPTSVYLLARAPEGHIFVVDEIWAQRMPVQAIADMVKSMLNRHNISLDSLETFVAGHDVFMKRDPTAPTIADQYATCGINLDPARVDRVNGAANLLALLGDVERGIKPRLTVFDSCPRLIECLPIMEHNPNRPEDILKVDVDQDGNGGDDPYDALRYGLMSIPDNSANEVWIL